MTKNEEELAGAVTSLALATSGALFVVGQALKHGKSLSGEGFSGMMERLAAVMEENPDRHPVGMEMLREVARMMQFGEPTPGWAPTIIPGGKAD